MDKRQCGNCRLCCKLTNISEVGTDPEGKPYHFTKRPGVWCEHSGPSGCALHATPWRPFSCRTFECLWFLGFGEESDRPDRSKIVGSLEHREFGATATTKREGLYAVLIEGAPGRMRSELGQSLTARLLRLPTVEGVEWVPFEAGMKRHHLYTRTNVLEVEIQGYPPPSNADLDKQELHGLIGEMPNGPISMSKLIERAEARGKSKSEILAVAERLRASHHRGSAV